MQNITTPILELELKLILKYKITPVPTCKNKNKKSAHTLHFLWQQESVSRPAFLILSLSFHIYELPDSHKTILKKNISSLVFKNLKYIIGVCGRRQEGCSTSS